MDTVKIVIGMDVLDRVRLVSTLWHDRADLVCERLRLGLLAGRSTVLLTRAQHGERVLASRCCASRVTRAMGDGCQGSSIRDAEEQLGLAQTASGGAEDTMETVVWRSIWTAPDFALG